MKYLNWLGLSVMLEAWQSQKNGPKSYEKISSPFTNKEKDAKIQNFPRNTIGSIVSKFRVKGTVITLPGRGRKRKLSTAATRFQEKPSSDCKKMKCHKMKVHCFLHQWQMDASAILCMLCFCPFRFSAKISVKK